MKSSKNFVCLLVIVCLLFCSCAPSSFVKAYEQKNIMSMIEFAVKDGLLNELGFAESDANNEANLINSIKKASILIDDIELSYCVYSNLYVSRIGGTHGEIKIKT